MSVVQLVLFYQPVVPAPNGAVVEVGEKKCKWCGSTTHSRKSHKDYPFNNSRVEGFPSISGFLFSFS